MNEQEIRRLLFTPCQTKEHFSNWIEFFLGLRLPDCTVSDESNSNPLDFAWECYDRMRRNDLEQFNRMMSYASRGGLKTLSASILEVIGLFHLGRNMAHMAAIVRQAKKGQEYVKGFFNKRYLRDFVHSDNASQVTVLGFHHAEKDEYLNELEWKALPVEIGNEYRRIENYVRIVVANMAGANGDHVEFMCVDAEALLSVRTTHKTGKENRQRSLTTARGVFGRIAGFSTGGNPKKIETHPMIVRNPEKDVEVLSLNMATGNLEWKKVLAGARSFKSRVEVVTDKKKLVCSPDHPVWIFGRGFVTASELKIGDRMLVLGKAKTDRKAPKFNKKFEIRKLDSVEGGQDKWEQYVIGGLMGDVGIYKKPTNNPYIQFNHCEEQGEWSAHKASVYAQKLKMRVNKGAKSGYTSEPQVGFQSGNSAELLPYANARKDLDLLHMIGPEALFVWYADDGLAGRFGLSTEGWNEQENHKICEFINEKFGFSAHVESYDKESAETGEVKTYFCIKGGVDDKDRLRKICAPYIHPSMLWKFDSGGRMQKTCATCGKNTDTSEMQNMAMVCADPMCQLTKKSFSVATVVGLNPLDKSWVYDFTVADNHNFFAEGLLVANCTDEVDVIPKQNIAAYHQAKSIPDSRDGLIPLTVLTSTRKSRVGLVQKEIEEAADTGLEIRHWNIIDVTQKCPPERHKPEGPKQTFYINDELIRHITEDDYKILDETQQKKYYPQEGFAGCGGCRLFSVCKGRLATEQKSDSPLLKPITEIISKFKGAPDADYITTEYMCRKPDASGLIYPKLKREIHSKTVDQIAEIAFGPGHGVKDKAALIQKFKENGASFYGGMDFGFSHDFSFVIMVVWGHRAFILDCMSRSGLELDEKIASSTAYRDLYSPTIFGDPAYPADILTFRRRGFKMKEWQKYPGSVKAGIEIMRMMMLSGNGDTRLYFLADDPGVEFLFNQLEKYSFQTDAAGEPTEDPVKENDDAADAIRYMVMNVIAPGGKLKIDAPASVIDLTPVAPSVGRNDYATQMSDIISKHTGGTTASTDSDSKIPVKPNGRFFFDP